MDNWTTRTLLSWITERFTQAEFDSPRLCAEILLGHVIGGGRMSLYTDADRPASAQEREKLRDLVKRALAHEPVQYLVGEWSFYGVELKTDERALIPRPSTETIIDHVLRSAKERPVGTLVDVCTGSGCIAIAIAKNLPETRVIATDLSVGALALAQENIERHGLGERIELRQGHLLEPVAGEGPYDAIVSNPPYIPDREWAEVEPNVKDYEPHLALRAGADGLDLIRPLLDDLPDQLVPGGLLAIELAASHAKDVLRKADVDDRLDQTQLLQDVEGLDRVLAARKA
ncbi:MAG: peptide chain release factor N(5)-glutamine methyltransferase [Planctomycetota bacterium]